MSTVPAVSACRFIGRRVSKCSKCQGYDMYVNVAGGLECYECHPPKTMDSCQVRLAVCDGFWRDYNDPDMAFLRAGSDSIQVATDKATSGLHLMSSNRPHNRRDGNLTAAESNVFASDLIWGATNEQWIVIGKAKSSLSQSQVTNVTTEMAREGKLNQSMEDMGLFPEAGDTINMRTPMRTFGGMIPAGAATISAVGKDAFGCAIVELSRNGRVLVTGVPWPIE